jgi:hypothetical protein
MEPMKAARTDEPISGSGGKWHDTAGQADTSDPARMRAELERLREREAQIMNLIGCGNPDKILHDLRNVLNELQLLRMLSETDKA